MQDNLSNMLRAAAKEWREEHKNVGVGEMRYDFALDEAADAIEELAKRVPPMPHGRCIDADALIKQARTQFDWNDVVDVEDIINAPTIIPASEGET